MSTLKVNTIQNASGVEVYTAKAWVNFNGTGTVAIRAAGNVSSITDNGTGDYTVNFTNAMVDANYSASVASEFVYSVTQIMGSVASTSSASGVRLLYASAGAGSQVDVGYSRVSVFR